MNSRDEKALCDKLFAAAAGDNALMICSIGLELRGHSLALESDVLTRVVNATNSEGKTPLMVAAKRGYLAIVSALLAISEVDVNARTAKGNTALMYAVFSANVAVVNALLAAPGIEIGAQNEARNTAAQLAVVCMHIAVKDGKTSKALAYKEICDTISQFKRHRTWENRELAVAERKAVLAKAELAQLARRMAGVLPAHQGISRHNAFELRFFPWSESASPSAPPSAAQAANPEGMGSGSHLSPESSKP